MLRLGGLAEADLVRRYDAITGLNQRFDRRFPGCGTKILSMQQYDSATVRLVGRNVHEGHGYGLAL
jgi:hypothetical protein